MSTRAKFFVGKVSQDAGFSGVTVELRPVTRGAANAPWASATPSGRIEMTITNPAAAVQFTEHLGREFYVTFDLVPDSALDPTQHEYVDAGLSSGTYGYECCIECGKPASEHTA